MAQTFKYTVVGDTQPAVKGNEALDASINKVDASSKQLESSLAKSGEALELSLQKQDAKIKAIGGSINILGGSVELVVGSLGLIGVDEKIVGQFQKAAVSAIAFADGAKRTVDGVKNLNEGLAASGGIIGTVTKSFNALKVAIATNPFTAIAVAIGVVVSALLIYNETTKESTEETEDYKKAVDGLNSSLKQTQSIAGANANSIGALSVAFKDGRITQELWSMV